MKEIQKISIVDKIVERIENSIKSGKYEIGEKLPTESDFCKMLKVSRSSLREAMRVLQALGYIEIKSGKGAYVASSKDVDSVDRWYDVDNAKFSDFMEVRMVFETLSVELAVERATKSQVEELAKVHELFVKANRNKDLVKLIMLDELFHTKMVSFTNNQLLININKQIQEVFRLYRSDSFMNESVYKNAEKPHERILACFQEKDSAQAVKEITNHLEITSKDMNIIHNKAAYENDVEKF